MKLPDGPQTLGELFKWPQVNAQKLLVESDQSEELVANFRKLSQLDIEVHDSYSGTGTASVTLHSQHSTRVRASLS